MGEYIDKLNVAEEVVELAALERVKEYYRTINGKKVHVSGHSRKGDGPNHRADMNAAGKSADHLLFGPSKQNFSQRADASGYKDTPMKVSIPKSSKASTDAETAAYQEHARERAKRQSAFQAAEAARAKNEVPPQGSLSKSENDEFQSLHKRLGKLTAAEEARYKALKAKAVSLSPRLSKVQSLLNESAGGIARLEKLTAKW